MAQIPKEVEVKLRVANRAQTMQRLGHLGVEVVHPRVHEMNTLFDTEAGNLARQGQIIRLRVERSPGKSAPGGARSKPETQYKFAGPQPSRDEVAALTYKGPVGSGIPSGHRRRKQPRYKIREEREVQVADAASLGHILTAMGLRPWFRYEKYRATFRLKRLRSLLVEFDETPVGDFLELEGKPADIDRAAALLGYAPADYILSSYGGLFLESLKRKGGALKSELTPHSGAPDMLFHKRKSRRRADFRK